MSQSAVIENDELGQRERMTRRKQLYWGILWGNVGIRIPFSQFRAAGKAVYNEHIGEAAVQNTLAAMRREPCPMPGGVLTVGQKHAQLDRTEMVLDEREEHRPQVKYLIGAALWTILTGVSPLEKRAEEKLEIVHHDWERVQKKIDALRLKALITMLIAAG